MSLVSRALHSAGLIALLAAATSSPLSAQGWMGVSLDVSEPGRIVVSELVDDGPAEKAGVRVDDQIVSWNGEKLASFEDLRAFLSKTEPGDKGILGLRRKDQLLSLRITLGKREDLPGEEEMEEIEIEEALEIPPGVQIDVDPTTAQHGIEIRRATAAGGGYMGVQLEETEDGVAVVGVVPGSPAAGAGIAEGEVLKQVDGKKVATVQDVVAAVRAKKPGDTIEVKSVRNSEGSKVGMTYVFHLGTAAAPQAAAETRGMDVPVAGEHDHAPEVHGELRAEKIVLGEPSTSGRGAVRILGSGQGGPVLAAPVQANLQREVAELRAELRQMRAEIAELKAILLHQAGASRGAGR